MADAPESFDQIMTRLKKTSDDALRKKVISLGFTKEETDSWLRDRLIAECVSKAGFSVPKSSATLTSTHLQSPARPATQPSATQPSATQPSAPSLDLTTFLQLMREDRREAEERAERQSREAEERAERQLRDAQERLERAERLHREDQQRLFDLLAQRNASSRDDDGDRRRYDKRS